MEYSVQLIRLPILLRLKCSLQLYCLIHLEQIMPQVSEGYWHYGIIIYGKLNATFCLLFHKSLKYIIMNHCTKFLMCLSVNTLMQVGIFALQKPSFLILSIIKKYLLIGRNLQKLNTIVKVKLQSYCQQATSMKEVKS